MLKQIQEFQQANGATTQRESMYNTMNFTADTAIVAAYPQLSPGNNYTMWIARQSGLTRSGKTITKGEWFITKQ